jgi:hypothetical protein
MVKASLSKTHKCVQSSCRLSLVLARLWHSDRGHPAPRLRGKQKTGRDLIFYIDVSSRTVLNSRRNRSTATLYAKG